MGTGRHYRRGSRWLGTVLLYGAAAAVGALGAFIWWATNDGHKPAPATISVAAPTLPPPTTTTLPSHISTSTSRPASRVLVTPSTTTPAAVAAPVVTSDSVTYRVPAGTTVLVTATNRCWIQVRASATSPVLQETILQTGQHVVLPTPMWVRLGDPTSARATVGATPLQLPVSAGELIVEST